ncbi:MAG TPA: hypothetical protein VFG69_18680, partial [Nannocystaceae bacterium]|nr:hypothetical protein [Nannocystaceae bacterium]
MPVEDYFTARDGDAAVIGDIRHLPVMITTWFGEPSEALVRHYFAWSDDVARQAIARGQRYVIISDNARARRPSPVVRKVVSKLIDAGPAAATDCIVATFVVFESALVRGAVTAMQWLSSKEWNMTTVATVQQAVAAALKAVDEYGFPRPARLSPATYVAPDPPSGPQVAA